MLFSFKKAISALIILMLLLSLCACKENSQQDDVSSEISVVSSDINSSKETETSSDTQVSEIASSDIPSESKEASKPSSSETAISSDNGNKPCQHNYTYLEIGVSCNKDGYRQYECKKCGHTKKGETVKAHHNFGKYLCEDCGIIDKGISNIFWGVNAWIKRFGKPNGNGDIYCYPSEVSAVAIGTPDSLPMLYLEYTDNANSISFSLSTDNKSDCYMQFFDMKSDTHASCDNIKNSAVSSANKLEFDYFSEDSSIDQDVFATECAKNIDIYMAEFQKLLNKSGITLKDLGFTAYK